MTLRVAITIAAPLLMLAGWSTASVAETAAPARPTMLVYGNYCGLGNNAPLAPIDALDAACSRHDDCTPDDGLPAKACNARLEREAGAIAIDLRQPDNVRMMAGLVAAFAANHHYKLAQDVKPSALPARMPRGAYMTLR